MIQCGVDCNYYYYYYLLYQLGTGGCTQKAQPIQVVYPTPIICMHIYTSGNTLLQTFTHMIHINFIMFLSLNSCIPYNFLINYHHRYFPKSIKRRMSTSHELGVAKPLFKREDFFLSLSINIPLNSYANSNKIIFKFNQQAGMHVAWFSHDPGGGMTL